MRRVIVVWNFLRSFRLVFPRLNSDGEDKPKASQKVFLKAQMKAIPAQFLGLLEEGLQDHVHEGATELEIVVGMPHLRNKR